MAASIRIPRNGDQEVTLQGKCQGNLDRVIAGETLDPADYLTIDSNLARFRRDMNAVMTQLEIDLTLVLDTGLGEGDSWFKCRDICKTNWEIIDAAINP